MSEIQTTDNTVKQYGSIGGWLILVAIGFILAPLKLVFAVLSGILPIFINGTWRVLSTPGTEVYSPLWMPVIIGELFGNLFFAAFSVVILIFLFLKKKTAPRLIIIFLASNLLFVLGDHIIAGLIPFVAKQENRDSLIEVIRTAIACSIWIPYFIVSKRVKGTFVK